MQRQYIIDLANRAMSNPQATREFVVYLRARVLERIAEGRSSDSDEYRMLLSLSSVAPSLPVDVSTISEYGLTQKLSNSIRCF